jgi:hypothetical protein
VEIDSSKAEKKQTLQVLQRESPYFRRMDSDETNVAVSIIIPHC